MNKYSDIEIQTAKNLLENGYKWIARNESGRLYAHSAKPNKGDRVWFPTRDETCVCHFVPIFQSIHFGDKEPTSLEAIVHPQILDDVERRYLRAVIRPFRDKVDFICKAERYDHDHQYIYIRFSDASPDTSLPLFRSGTMYKGMKLGRGYSLEELGLV